MSTTATRHRSRTALENLKSTQKLRSRRGHDFYPPMKVWESIPTLGEYFERDEDDPFVYLHYFSAASDHWVVAVDDDGTAYGYADLGYPEWGAFFLPEMEEILAHGGLVIIERDCYMGRGGLASEVIPNFPKRASENVSGSE